jgi:high-affinity nickel-transport protein
MPSLLIGLLFGLAQGLRHAFEPDHIAAVSTMVAEQRSARASIFFAAMWGAGHALMLLVVGGALFVLRREMPQRLAHGFELLVAVMLIALGVRALRQAVRAGRAGASGASLVHRHGTRTHVHGVAESHVHVRRWTLARRPLLIGIVHGLAGSGALTAIVASSQPSAASGLLFMALYGAGATLGMALLAGFAGVPLARAMRTRYGAPILLGVTGVFSLALGLVWGWPIVHAMTLG